MMMRVLILLSLLITACGKHESSNTGFSDTSPTKKGAVASSAEDFLRLAIDKNDRPAFEKLLEESTNLNLVFANGLTPLIYSVQASNAAFVYLLVAKGADKSLVDSGGKTALDHAVESGKMRIALLLDETKQALQQTDLFAAVMAEDVDLVHSLLRAGTNPNFVHADGEIPLTQSIRIKAIGVYKTIARWKDEELGLTATNINLANAAGEKPLTVAKQTKNKNFIKVLEELGAQE